MLPSSYVQIVDNNEDKVVENDALPPPPQQQAQQQQQQQQQATCLDEATCPYAQLQHQQHQQQRRPSSSLERLRGSQSTLNTLCSHHSSRLSKRSQPNAFYNRLYNSDPNTVGETHSHITDDSEYLSNYAHIKHSHRHPHYHFRRQSQPNDDDDPRLMSRNSSLKSFTSQCYINPEYFYEIRPSRSCDDSKASLISRKQSQNQIMLLNSELQMLEGLREGLSNSYPKINYIEKHYLSLNDDIAPMQHDENEYDIGDDTGNADEDEVEEEVEEEVDEEEQTSSTTSECSDGSEFHENKTSTLDRTKSSFHSYHHHHDPRLPSIPMFSETDSYSTVNDEITQLVSKHLSNSIKQLVARQLTDTDCYALPLRRRHSCDSSELSDIQIPDLFNSPSRIKWNFLTGLPDRSRSQSQICSSDYKTDEDDEGFENKIDQILKRKSSSLDPKYHGHHCEYEIIPNIWRANSYGRARADFNSITSHHRDNQLIENYCEAHYSRLHDVRSGGGSYVGDDGEKKSYPNGNVKKEEVGTAAAEGGGQVDSTVYEFELCTKENCEYLSKSQIMNSPLKQNKNLLNNEIPSCLPSSTKNINLKHNKFKMKKIKKGKSKSTAAAASGGQKENREQHDMIMWNKININNLMKKECCDINSVNFKPHSSSSSSNSINQVGNSHNIKRRKACDKLLNANEIASTSLNQQQQQQPLPSSSSHHRHHQHHHRQQQSLNVASLILASFNSTQARIRNDGGIYFSNPDLSNIPADLRSMNFINNSSCQFINNDLRNNVNSNSSYINNNSNNSRSQFDSRFNNFNSATNYLLESINSNNDNSNNSEIMQQQDLRRRLRYINLHGMLRRAQKRAKKYLNSISFASRK